MNKVTIETPDETITADYIGLDLDIDYWGRKDYRLNNLSNIVKTPKTFVWRFCYEKNTSDLIACLDTYNDEQSAKQRLKLALHKNAYQAVSYDGEVLVLPKGKFYIMKVEKQ